mgnify:CR=1 FL=1
MLFRSALVAAQASVHGTTYAFGWRETLRDGRDVTVRLSRPEDVAGVSALHDRCSEQSRYQRYFTRAQGELGSPLGADAVSGLRRTAPALGTTLQPAQ